nr:solute carrier family 22 member 7-like [Rhipicephalus microplus]
MSLPSTNRAIAAPAQRPADDASRVPMLPSQSNVVNSAAPSRSTSDAARPTGAFLLAGFVDKNNWDAIQENTYVVLGHGPYQRRVLMCGILALAVLLFQYLAYRLTGRKVGHWCKAPDQLASVPADIWKNLSIPVEVDGSYSNCTIYDPPEPVSQEENRTAINCHEWSYDIANKADSIVSRFDLVCDREYLYDLSEIVPLFGSGLVSPALGLVADHVGRRPVMLACAFTQLFATVANTFSETYPLFLFTRFLIFAATDVTFIATFTLLHEVTGNARRSTFTLIDIAVPHIFVPPLLHVISIVKPRWMLANALTIVTTGLLASWCWLVEESPTWLVATRDLRRAEVTVLLAARENGVDVAKARTTFKAIEGQLRRLDTCAMADPMEAIIETMKLRRRAASVLLARFVMDATYISLIMNDVTTGIRWEAAYVLSSVVCYASALGCMRSCGIRKTLSGVMVMASTFAVFEAMVMSRGEKVLTLYVHAGLKVFVSTGSGVTLCYTAETFPTVVRNAGICLSHFAGGMGCILGAVIIGLSGLHVFYLLSAFMVLLSAAAIQWLPEVVIEKAQLPGVATVRERKAALVASLESRGVRSAGKYQ